MTDDDFQVLVIDADVLATIDRLYLSHQVLLQRLLALDSENVVRNQRSFDQRITGFDLVSGMDQQVLVLRYVMLLFHAAFALHDDRHLAAPLVRSDFYLAGDLGHNRRFFGSPSFEDLGHARQSTGNILCAADGPWLTRQLHTWLDLLPFNHLNACFCGQVVVVQDVSILVLNHNLRVLLALVFNHHELRTTALLFQADGLAFSNILKANEPATFREDRRQVRIPLT